MPKVKMLVPDRGRSTGEYTCDSVPALGSVVLVHNGGKSVEYVVGDIWYRAEPANKTLTCTLLLEVVDRHRTWLKIEDYHP